MVLCQYSLPNSFIMRLKLWAAFQMDGFSRWIRRHFFYRTYPRLARSRSCRQKSLGEIAQVSGCSFFSVISELMTFRMGLDKMAFANIPFVVRRETFFSGRKGTTKAFDSSYSDFSLNKLHNVLPPLEENLQTTSGNIGIQAIYG